ncbi:cupredoxin domain-containing protein [uncultured Limosilactobacillus sp.]|uniref:cupredoxin domain-containing protein n=1 Tax=uncultured Limosilactobacillus sp. TaxID=2837629 RepID=UPI0025F00D8C|nr:cupredoxin domain-containing protein [uncultured Limosilactobacillus sp.]
MQTMMILIISLLLIGAIIWWFFGSHEQAVANATAHADHQEATVVVKGGYSPETVVLKKGVPATLTFEMKDSTACLSHVVFDKLGVDRDLTKQKVTQVNIPTDQAGDIDFACGMNMFHGKVVVK